MSIHIPSNIYMAFQLIQHIEIISAARNDIHVEIKPKSQGIDSGFEITANKVESLTIVISLPSDSEELTVTVWYNGGIYDEYGLTAFADPIQVAKLACQLSDVLDGKVKFG